MLLPGTHVDWELQQRLVASKWLIGIYSIPDLNDTHLKSDAIFTLCHINKVMTAPDRAYLKC